jgi:O-antigen/teichoic acid export membrane protein
MGLLASGDELAWFGASHRIIMALHTFVYLYFFNLLPSLARGAGRPIEHVQKLVSRSLGWTAWAGIAGALAISMVGGDLLTVVFGSKYAGVHGPLAVLGWLIPAALINGHYRYMLIACNQQGLEFRCTAISAATALGLAAVLIPRYGAIGAASAIVASSLVNLGLAFAYVNSRIARLPFLRQMVLPLATGIIVITCFASLAQAGPWPAAALAGMTYLAVFMIWVGWNFLRGEFVVAPVSNAVRL